MGRDKNKEKPIDWDAVNKQADEWVAKGKEEAKEVRRKWDEENPKR